MSHANYSGIELIVLYYTGDHDLDIRSTIRKALGDTNWSANDTASPVVAKLIMRGSTAREVRLVVDSLNQAATGAILLCHPSLTGVPSIWMALEAQQKNDFDVRQCSAIRLCKSGAAFRSILVQILREKRIDIESKLRRVLLDTHGKDTVDHWKSQFASVGRKDYADFIISAIHLIERRHLSNVLDQMSLDPFATCVLIGDGSDLAIRRKLEGKPGWPQVPCLDDFLKRNGTSQVAIVVDAIHGGGQIVSCIRGLLERIRQKAVIIRVLPIHVTRRGIRHLTKEIEAMNLSTIVSIDCSNAIVLENEALNSWGESVSVPELDLRMKSLGYSETVVTEVRKFATKIGALLEQVQTGDEFPDNTKGLGLHFMGLTTLIDGYPGLGVLPIIRTSCPKGSTMPFEGRLIDWQALVTHQNDQAITSVVVL